MRHALAATFSLLALAAAAIAQDPAPTPATDATTVARQKLQKAIAATGALPSCAFAAKWAVDETGKKKDDTQVIFAGSFGGEGPGEATGAWADGRLHLQQGADEVLYVGRHMLAREQGGAWSLRRGKFANGAQLEFQPDPQLLLAALGGMELAVVHREAGAWQDRPFDVVTVTLNQDQVTELARVGALPTGVLQGMFGGNIVVQQLALAAGGAGAGGPPARPAPPPPDATVDLAFWLEPGTGMLHRVVVRGTSKNGGGAFGGRVFIARAGAGGIQVANNNGGDDDDEAEDEKAAKDDAKTAAGKDAPLVYKDGLPQRPRKKMQVFDYAIELKDHGKAQVPALDDKAKALLGIAAPAAK